MPIPVQPPRSRPLRPSSPCAPGSPCPNYRAQTPAAAVSGRYAGGCGSKTSAREPVRVKRTPGLFMALINIRIILLIDVIHYLYRILRHRMCYNYIIWSVLTGLSVRRSERWQAFMMSRRTFPRTAASVTDEASERGNRVATSEGMYLFYYRIDNEAYGWTGAQICRLRRRCLAEKARRTHQIYLTPNKNT